MDAVLHHLLRASGAMTDRGTVGSRCDSERPTFDHFVFSRFCIPAIEQVIYHAVGAHLVSSELPDCAAWRHAGELVGSLDCLSEFNAGRRSYEMHRPAHVAEDAHVDRHCREDYGTESNSARPLF